MKLNKYSFVVVIKRSQIFISKRKQKIRTVIIYKMFVFKIYVSEFTYSFPI